MAGSKKHIKYEDGTEFLSYHENHGYYFPFIDYRMDKMSKDGPFDVWLKGKYTDGDITVKETDTVIDCGSFVGAFSMASAIMGAEKVYAIEPSSRNFHCLNKNIAHFGAESVITPINIGLGDEDTTLKLNLSHLSCEDSFMACDQDATGTCEEVQVLRLDTYIEQAGIDVSNLYLKVEAEGLEPEIIRGLGELKPRVIVVDVTPERNGASPRNLIKEILKDKGYSFKDTKRCLFAY